MLHRNGNLRTHNSVLSYTTTETSELTTQFSATPQRKPQNSQLSSQLHRNGNLRTHNSVLCHTTTDTSELTTQFSATSRRNFITHTSVLSYTATETSELTPQFSATPQRKTQNSQLSSLLHRNEFITTNN
jgi:arginine/ornithine N-succinyltransferase beta subunit